MSLFIQIQKAREAVRRRAEEERLRKKKKNARLQIADKKRRSGEKDFKVGDAQSIFSCNVYKWGETVAGKDYCGCSLMQTDSQLCYSEEFR